MLLSLLLQCAALSGNTYTPRSYWRFENASDLWQDSQGKQTLSSFEGIGAGEVQLWRPQTDGGIVGGWVDSTGEAINASKYKPPYYWERHMGTVPLDSCSKCKCNGTCTGSASASGFTIEVLLKPNPVCFSSSFPVSSTRGLRRRRACGVGGGFAQNPVSEPRITQRVTDRRARTRRSSLSRTSTRR